MASLGLIPVQVKAAVEYNLILFGFGLDFSSMKKYSYPQHSDYCSLALTIGLVNNSKIYI